MDSIILAVMFILPLVTAKCVPPDLSKPELFNSRLQKLIEASTKGEMIGDNLV